MFSVEADVWTRLPSSSRTAQFLIFINSVLWFPDSVPSLFCMGEAVSRQCTMPTPQEALPGRDDRLNVNKTHAVSKNTVVPPFPDNLHMAMFGMGCFWGAERLFWKQAGVFSTQIGYSAGYTPNPTYKEVCSGSTGHNEVVRVVFDPKFTTYSQLLKVFWENHNPTEFNRQGNDHGTQYRSGIYYYNSEQKSVALSTRDEYQKVLNSKGYNTIQTEIVPATEFYYAEDYHQQYLHKNPQGYCGLGGTGVTCPIGIRAKKGADIFMKNEGKTEL